MAPFGLLAIVLGAIAIWRWESFANINRGWLPDAEIFRSRRFWRSVYVATGSCMILFGIVAVVIGVAQTR